MTKWITIGACHINIEMIACIKWSPILENYLVVDMQSSDGQLVFEDIDRTIYRRLCEAVGVEPVEVLE